VQKEDQNLVNNMFKKQFRLTRDKEFEKVFKKGKSSYDKSLGIKIVKNELDYNRFGVIVSTKISKKAVDRNKIKRRLREILKNIYDNIHLGYDVVVIALPLSKEKSFQELEKSVFFSLKRLNLLKSK
jgi:ribonuclease P protein component